MEGTPDKPVSDVRLFLTAEEYSIGGVQCASRATNLLVVGDDRSRHLVVDDKRQIRLVVPHA